MKTIAVLPNGDKLYRKDKALILEFQNRRRVISTSLWLGGIRDDLKTIYNLDLKDENGQCQIEEEDYGEALKNIAVKLGLDPLFTAGMTTAVFMDDMAMSTAVAGELWVTAIVTGGIERNGGCAGDPGSYDEGKDGYIDLTGTINIIVTTNASLAPGTITQALTTVIEAKAAAVRQLRLPSLYSLELATGSGTDGVFVVSDITSSGCCRRDAGKHSLLGELIGRAAKTAVVEALVKHSSPANLDMDKQSNVLKRFSITHAGLTRYLEGKDCLCCSASELWSRAEADKDCGVKARIFAGLCDDLRHDIGTKDSVYMAIEKMLGFKIEDTDFTELWYKYLVSHYFKP